MLLRLISFCISFNLNKFLEKEKDTRSRGLISLIINKPRVTIPIHSRWISNWMERRSTSRQSSIKVSSRRGEERKKQIATAFDDYLPRQPKRNRDRNEEKRVAERGFIRDLRGRLIVSMEPEQRSVSLTRDGVDLPSTIMCDQVDTLSIFNEEERRVEVQRGLDFYYWKLWYSVASFHYYLLSKVFITIKGSEYLLLFLKLIGDESFMYTCYLRLILYMSPYI